MEELTVHYSVALQMASLDISLAVTERRHGTLISQALSAFDLLNKKIYWYYMANLTWKSYF